MSAETALAHAGLSGENWKREVVGQMVADPVVKRSKLVLGNLKGQKLTELRLPARSLEKDDQITSDGQRRRAAQILLHQRQGEVDTSSHPGRGPDRAVLHENGIGLDMD